GFSVSCKSSGLSPHSSSVSFVGVGPRAIIAQQALPDGFRQWYRGAAIVFIVPDVMEFISHAPFSFGLGLVHPSPRERNVLLVLCEASASEVARSVKHHAVSSNLEQPCLGMKQPIFHEGYPDLKTIAGDEVRK